MKPFIILFGDTYYPGGWQDYVGEADTLEEAIALAEKRGRDEGTRSPEYWWWEIVDLRTKKIVKRS